MVSSSAGSISTFSMSSGGIDAICSVSTPLTIYKGCCAATGSVAARSADINRKYLFMRCFFPVNGRWGGNIARPPVSLGTCEDNGFAAERQIFPRFSVRGTVCRAVFPGVACGAGLSGRFSRVGFRGPVFAGAFVGCLLPGWVPFRAVLDSASCLADFNCASCGGDFAEPLLPGVFGTG